MPEVVEGTRTFAGNAIKNEVSHLAKAMPAMKPSLLEYLTRS